MFKKLLLFGAALLISASTFAQTNPAAEEAKTIPRQAEQLALAGYLVKYGYETQTALPLIQAVQIYQQLNVQPALDGEKTETQDAPVSDRISKTERPILSEEQLLADATTYADGNKILLALIKDCKGTTRGAAEGPVSHYARVRAKSTDIWRIRFRGGEAAYVVVSGDGDTDLDLYIFDENGNLITSDTNYSDHCTCSFTPRRTGYFCVKIKNRGIVCNYYSLITN